MSDISVLLPPVRHWTGGSLVGDLPLHELMADEAMVAVLRSAGHSVTTFMQAWRGFATVPLGAAA